MANATMLLEQSTLRNSILGNVDALLINPADSLPQAMALPAAGDPSALLGGLTEVSGAPTVAPVLQPTHGPLGPVDTVLSALGDGSSPIAGVANDAVLDLHASLELVSHQLGSFYAVHGVTNLGETIGLGRLGDSNLLTDVVNVPSDALSGDTTHLSHIPSDVTPITNAVNGLVRGVEIDVNSGQLGHDALHNLPQVVDSITSFPATNLAGSAADAVHTTLEGALDSVLPNALHGVTGIGSTIGSGEIGGSGVLTDVAHTVSTLSAGNTTSLGHLPYDVANVVEGVGQVVTDVGHELGQSPATGAVSGVLGGGVPTGGLPNLGSVAGAVTGALSNLEGGSTGSHDLITVAVGPQTSPGGIELNVLSTSSNDPAHIVDVHAITVPGSVPTLANVSVLTDSLHLSSIPGGGADALSGVLAQAALPLATAQPEAHAATDIGPGPTIDLAHLDPLASLGHAIHHA